MKELRNKINQNYSKASQYVHRRRYLTVPVSVITGLTLILFFAADYALAYSFFAKLAENGIGVVPDGMKFIIGLKAMLAVAAAVVVKFAFSKMPKIIQFMITILLLIGSIVVVSNMGAAQITQVMIDSVERIFPGEVDIQAQLGDLFGDGVITQSGQEESDMTPQASEKISKSHYVIKFSYYGYAYLMMTFAGVFTWMALSSLYARMQRLNQVSKAFLERYDELIKKEKELNLAQDSESALWSSKRLICRGAQDIAIGTYCIGLDYLKKQVGDLKIYADIDGTLKNKYKSFQTYGARRIMRLDVGVAEDRIEKADASLADLRLIDIEDNNSNITNFKLVGGKK